MDAQRLVTMEPLRLSHLRLEVAEAIYSDAWRNIGDSRLLFFDMSIGAAGWIEPDRRQVAFSVGWE